MSTNSALRPSFLGLAAVLLSLAPTAGAFTWTGAGTGRFTDVQSWQDAPPAPGAANRGDLVVINDAGAPLEYTAAEGDTTFTGVDFKVGNSNKPAGHLVVSGGSLTILARNSPIVGQNNTRTSTLTITGGRVTVANQPTTIAREAFFRIGNGYRGTLGILEMSGGALFIETPGTETESGFVIASGPADGRVRLTGAARVEVTNPNGTAFQPANSLGVGILTFGPGKGVFVQTASKTISFGKSAGGDASHLNFESGSDGRLVLFGANPGDFAELVHARKILVDSESATPETFAYSAVGGYGVFRLATSAIDDLAALLSGDPAARAPIPAPKISNRGDFIVTTSEKSAYEHGAADGHVVVNCTDFKIGGTNQPAGELRVTSGGLTINTHRSPVVGQDNGLTNLLTITGGRLIINNTAKTPERERVFRVGNGMDRTVGVIAISGGELVVNSPGHDKEPGFVIARGKAGGWVHLTGGVLRVTSPHGSGFQPENGDGTGILTLGQGHGMFIQTASKKIVFGAGHRGIENYIDFESGSKGLLSLAGATRADFEALVTTGHIRIDNQVTTPDQFIYSFDAGQGTYRLASSKK